MKPVAAAVLALAFTVPVGAVGASGSDISEPTVALRSANRVGNAKPTSEPAGPPASAPNVSTEMQQVLDLVNAERVARGLVALQFDAQLNDVAMAHTQSQATAGEIFHTDPRTGLTPGDRITDAGYRFSTWGENVAAGYQTPADVTRGWLNSPGHCKNVLNPAFTEIGIGYVSGGAVYDHFWTQVFARPAGVPRPAGTYDPAWC